MNFIKKYFKTMISPTKTFKNRKYLTTIQKIIVFSLLLLLLIIPTLFSISTLDNLSFYNVVPEAGKLLKNEEVLAEIKEIKLDKDQFSIDKKTDLLTSKNGIVSLSPDDQNIEWKESDGLLVVMKESSLEIYDPHLTLQENPVVDFPFTDTKSIWESNTPEELSSRLESQWNETQRKATKSTLAINLISIISIMFIFIFGTFTILLYLLKFFGTFSIRSYSEAFTISLNIFGIPTFLVFIVGLSSSNPILMVPLQLLVSIFMLLASYFKTFFSDEYLEQKE